ncbi:MAG: tail fiber domain-containing protein [Flavobacteriia bacterium]
MISKTTIFRTSTVVFIFLLGINKIFAQQNVGISETPITPDLTSILEVYSTSKGILIPRLTTVQRNGIATPANGLLVFDTDVDCFMFYSSLSTGWQSLCSSSPSGNTYLISSSVVAPGPSCPAGGVQLSFGFDLNSNTVLDPSEIVPSMNAYVCNGTQGSAGATGPQGPAGAAGLNGADGATGPQGPIGLTGAAGPQGQAGADGAAGTTGPQGPIGLTGNGIVSTTDNGNGTFTFTYTDGTTFTTSDLTGAAGAAGPQGPAGADGIDGATGPQGPIGLTGATGPAGPQGPIGLTGATGPAGADGATGAQGPIGLTGAQGPIGLTGATGPAGPTGPQGPTWTITSDNFTAAGNLEIVTTYPQTVNSTNQAWLVGGNNFGTTATAYKLGTLSNDHVDFYTNNSARGRAVNTGEFIWGNTALVGSSAAGDVLTANKVNGGTANNWAVNGMNTTAGGGSGYFDNTTNTNTYSTLEAIQNYNGSAFAPPAIKGIAIAGNNSQTAVGVRAVTNGRDGYGVWGSRVGTTGALGFGGVFQNGLGYTGALSALSDSRTKTNVRPMENALDIIKNLKGVNYEYDLVKYPYLGLSEGKQYGFIAQELEAVLPELVELHSLDINGCKPMEARDESKNKLEQFKMVNYVGVIPILVEGMKEQQEIIEIQQKTIDELRSEIEKIKIEINKK